MLTKKAVALFIAFTLLAVVAIAPSDIGAATIDWEEVENLREVPDEIGRWVETKKHEQGIHLLSAGTHRYLLIAWGEKPTGGYEVKVDEDNIREWQKTLHVDAKLVAPDPDDMVTQALTYPYALLRLPADDTPVLVNFYGEVWREAKLDDAQAGEEIIVLEPVLTTDDQAPNPLVVRGWAQVYEGTMELVLEDGHLQLAEAQLMLATGGPEWAEFEIALTYPNPTSPTGTVYGAYTDAEDGSRVEVGVSSFSFGDISRPMRDLDRHWAEASIRQAISAGFIHGYADGEERYFSPETEVTRAEFIKMLVAAQTDGELDVGDEQLPFEDVEGHWAEPYIRWAMEQAWISSEKLDDRMYPDEVISRGEMASLAARVAGLSDVEDPELAFADADDIDPSLQGWVAAATENGLLFGYPDDTFRPDDGLKRAEAVVVVWRVLNQID